MKSVFYRAGFVLGALALVGEAPTPAQALPSVVCATGECLPVISALQYNGRNAYRLTNGREEAIIVPQIGRVMRYGRVGGPNLLWNAPVAPSAKDAWKNYGGDKTWLAPQSSWKQFHGSEGWPPDPAHDGKPHQAEVLSGGKVRLTTPLSSSGIRLTRTLYFDTNGDFVVEQTARKERGAPIRASIWSITQIVPGEAVFLPRALNSDYPQGFHFMGKPSESQKIVGVRPNLLRVSSQNRGGGGKIGLDSPVSKLISVRNGVAFLQKSAKPAGVYPEGAGGAGFPIELYTQGEEKNFYVELEVLGPLKNFAVGGKSTHTVRWSLHDLPSKDVNSPAVVGSIEKLLFGR